MLAPTRGATARSCGLPPDLKFYPQDLGMSLDFPRDCVQGFARRYAPCTGFQTAHFRFALSGKIRGIPVDLSSDGFGEKSRLRKRDKPRGHLFPEEGMDLFLMKTLVPIFQEDAVTFLGEEITSIFLPQKMLAFDLTAVEQREDKSVDVGRAKFLEHIEGEARSPASIGVQKTELHIEPCRFERAFHPDAQESISERKERIDGIEWRMTRASFHEDGGIVDMYELREDPKIRTGEIALISDDLRRINGLFHPPPRRVALFDHSGKILHCRRAISRIALQEHFGVPDFRLDEALGKRERRCGIRLTCVLEFSGMHGALGIRFPSADVVPIGGEIGYGDVLFCTKAQQSGAHARVIEADDAPEVVDGEFAHERIPIPHFDRAALAPEKIVRLKDVEGIAKDHHGRCTSM